MNKKAKSVLFVIGAVVILALIVIFGYLGFTGDKIVDRMTLSYTDSVTMKNGELEEVHSGAEFINEDATKCRMNLKWGDDSQDYSILTIVKVTAPSGKTACWVTGDRGDFELEFDLEEKGTYKISSMYFADGNKFRDACFEVDPQSSITLEEDGSFDGFVFSGKDGKWNQKFDIQIVTFK